MVAKRYLTKSRFKLGRECPTKLFYTGKKDQFDDQFLDNTFIQALVLGGFQVGELAKIYYPGGHAIESLDYNESCAHTEELLRKDNVVIYEAAFRHDELFVRVDILVKTGQQVKLIEVKAKSIDPTEDEVFYDKAALKRGKRKLKSKWVPYLEDVAFQTYVARKNFPSLSFTPYLMFADKSKAATVEGLNQKFLLLQKSNGRQEVRVKDGTDAEAVGEQILCRICVTAEVELLHQGDGGKSYESIVSGLASAYAQDQMIAPQLSAACKSCQFRSEDSERSGFHYCWRRAAGLSDDELKGPFVL
jgi:hypothetical protein